MGGRGSAGSPTITDAGVRPCKPAQQVLSPVGRERPQGWALGCSRETKPTAQWTSGMGADSGVSTGERGWGSTQAACGVRSLF